MSEISQIKERFLQFLKFQGINEQEAFDNLGFSKWNFTGKSKKSELGGDKIREISQFFPEISLDWLITGNGSMLRDTAKSNNSEITQIHSHTGIPLIPIEAIAGIPATDNEGICFADCEHYNIPDFINKGVEYMIRVSGSSMYPKYSNGDLLACRRIHDILFFQWGKIYVIDSSQGALVKRIFEDTENPDNIILVSDNKEKYPPFSFPKSDIRSLSIVVGVIRLE